MKLLREPLVHFLLLGALLFVVYGAVSDEGAERDDQIIVSTADIEGLAARWQLQWKRPPTAKELSGLIDEHVRQEVYYRQAVALGLDRNDIIVRRRMTQKMEFLSEDLAVAAEPSREELLAWFEENAERYAPPPRVSFSHVYFSADGRDDPEGDALAVLATLTSLTTPPERAPELGDRFMLQYDYPRKSEDEVARHFGSDFARALMELEGEGWKGPMASGYGVHLVNVHGRVEGRNAALEEVEKRVSTDFLAARRKMAKESLYAELLKQYDVRIEAVQAAEPPSAP